MELTYVPLLQLQRDLYAIPRGFERFREYIRTLTGGGDDLELPLVAMNPMGKEHLPQMLDELLAQDADGRAAVATAAAQAELTDVDGKFRVSLIVSDDLMGGWTNRYAAEYAHRFGSRPLHRRGWVTGILWTSERYTAETAAEQAKTAIYRAAHIQQHGYAQTLGEMLAQEGYAMARAELTRPLLAADELAYTHAVLADYLASDEQPTHIAALFGDGAARELGYRPLGLSERAGLALALAQARGLI